jgi:FolB domain-containing protein
MSDLIRIHRFEAWTYLGVPDEERVRRQRILISIDLTVKSLKSAALTDEVATTIDYANVCSQVQEVAAERPRKLAETLAEDIAGRLLREYSELRKVEVEIEKFAIPEAASVGVLIERKRSEIRPG